MTAQPPTRRGGPGATTALPVARGPAVGLAVVAVLWAWRGRPVLAALAAVLALVWLQVAVVWPPLARRAAAIAERVGHVVAVGLSLVALGVTWLVVVVPVALLNRLLRIDLLDHGAGGRWQRADGRRAPRRLYRAEARPSGAVGRRILRLAVVVVALGATTVVVVDHATRVPPPPLTPFGERVTDAGTGVVYHDHWATYHGTPVSRHLFPGEPWGAEILAIHDGKPPCDAVNVERMDDPAADYASRYVNVVDGRRRTLAPRHPERTVWMFGGSTTYGVGQRDEHTIASDLVRLARAEGVRLSVVNLGCPGEVNWSETLHFERLLRSGATPPDAAIFLDGINEWDRAFTREIVGLLDESVPFAGYASADDQAALLADARSRGYVETHDQRRQMRLAAAQYRMGVERARALGDEYGVPVVHFWQPALFTMPTTAPGNPTVYASDEIDPATAMVSGGFYREAAARSGVDPIDLMDIFDDADRPLFFDCCHTNEAGARLEAAAMYPYVTEALGRPGG